MLLNIMMYIYNSFDNTFSTKSNYLSPVFGAVLHELYMSPMIDLKFWWIAHSFLPLSSLFIIFKGKHLAAVSHKNITRETVKYERTHFNAHWTSLLCVRSGPNFPPDRFLDTIGNYSEIYCKFISKLCSRLTYIE